MKYQSEAATEKAAATSISGVTCKSDSIAPVLQINSNNNSWSVYSSGQRIASFIHEAKAIHYARAVT